jgi:hypothetical protein
VGGFGKKNPPNFCRVHTRLAAYERLRSGNRFSRIFSPYTVWAFSGPKTCRFSAYFNGDFNQKEGTNIDTFTHNFTFSLPHPVGFPITDKIFTRKKIGRIERE